MRSLKTFMILCLAVLLLGFTVGCDLFKAKSPASPDIQKIIDDNNNNDNNDPCACCENEVTVEYTGTPVTAKTCRWEITLKSVERFKYYWIDPGTNEYRLADFEMVIAKYSVKNVWEKESFYSDIPRSSLVFGMESTYPKIKAEGYGFEFYLGADDNASWPTFYYKPNPSGPMERVPDFDCTTIEPDEEIEIVDSFVIELYPHEVEGFYNSPLTLEFSGDGVFALVQYPEREGETGCGWLEQIIKFRLLTIN